MTKTADTPYEPEGLALEVAYYLHEAGAAFVMKLAKRLNADPGAVKLAVRELRDNGFVERVTGAEIAWRLDKRTKVAKHRNHTYYDLTRTARRYMRQARVRVDINLRPPYKQA